MRKRAKVTYWPGAYTPVNGLTGSNVWAHAAGAFANKKRLKLARKVLCVELGLLSCCW